MTPGDFLITTMYTSAVVAAVLSVWLVIMTGICLFFGLLKTGEVE